jgi:Tol biopolymer transport system component
VRPAGNGGLVLAFARHFEAVNIWRQDLNGHVAPSRWIASSRRDLTPEYSPDGKRIAFTSDRGGSEEIWVAAGDGSDPQQWSAFNGVHVGAPRWSPDGRRIVFDADSGAGFRIYTIDAPRAVPQLLMESDRPVWLPVWSPDGRWIVFSATWTGRTRVWKIPSSGGRAEEVTREEASSPWFSPDGRFLYYLSSGSDNHVWRMPWEGGTPQRVVEWVGAFTVGQGGVYFTRFRPGDGLGDTAIYYLDQTTGRTTTVVTETARLRPGLAISPDGRSLLFAQVAYEVSDLVLARQR